MNDDFGEKELARKTSRRPLLPPQIKRIRTKIEPIRPHQSLSLWIKRNLNKIIFLKQLGEWTICSSSPFLQAPLERGAQHFAGIVANSDSERFDLKYFFDEVNHITQVDRF